jgi:O-acetyl-ADP-ribose deacetylase (regulator of RNase III)
VRLNRFSLMDEPTNVNPDEIVSVCLPLNVAIERQGQDFILCGPILEDVLSAFQLVLKVIDQKSSSVLYAADNDGASARAEAQLRENGKEQQERLVSGSESPEVSSHGEENVNRGTAIVMKSRQTQTDEHELQHAVAEQSSGDLLKKQRLKQKDELKDAPLSSDEFNSEEENALKNKTKEDQRRQQAGSARLNECNLQESRKTVKVTAAEWEFLDKYYMWEVQKAFRGVAVTVIPPTAVAAAASYDASQDVMTLEAADLSKVDIASLEAMPRKLDLGTQFHDLSAFYQHREAVAVLQHIIESEHKQVLLAPHPDCYTPGSPLHGYVRLVTQKSAARSANDRLCVLVTAYGDCLRGPVRTHLANNSQVNVYGTTVPGIPFIIMDRSRLIMYMFDKNSGAGQPRDNVPANGVISVSIMEGDLLTMKGGALVNATDPELSFRGGISRVIANKAGRAIVGDARKACKQQHGSIVPLAQNVVTGAGDLRDVAFIIHAVGPVRDFCSSENDCRDKLAATFFNCLRQADILQVTSIALPAIGSGNSCDILQ